MKYKLLFVLLMLVALFIAYSLTTSNDQPAPASSDGVVLH